MNLTHLFNMNYFIQNLKKSKAVIIFISLLLPVFTLLTLNIYNESYENVVQFAGLGAPNIFFMYIIPVVLSIQLFNYVFKKKSCDFIGSMPISRKTIFVTNTIGGIVLLTLMQLVTAILSLVFSKVFSTNIIFGSMIWDIFIFFTISYIFVFVVTNLAISFSGNVFATIVSTLLILFFIPYIMTFSKINALENLYFDSYRIDTDNAVVEYYKPFNFTAPSMLFDVSTSDGKYEYNTSSVVKMAVLSILYFAIGLILFNRKKFEMAEESYESTKMHLIMKFLSITPFVSILSILKLYENSIALTFFLVVLAVYFFIFDMITNKKIKLNLSILTFAISLLTMFAIFELIVPHLDVLYKKEIKVADVESITIDSVKINSQYYNEIGLVISDRSIINEILNDSNNYNYSSSIDYYPDYDTILTLKDSKGNTYKIRKRLGKTLSKAVSAYGGDQQYINSKNNGVPFIDACKLNNKDRKELVDLLNEDLNGITIKEYYNAINSDRENYYLTFAKYNNHKLIVSDYSYGGFKKVTDKTIEICNRETVNSSKRIVHFNMSNQEVFGKYLIKNNIGVHFEDLSDYADLIDEALIEEIKINEYVLEKNPDLVNMLIDSDSNDVGYSYEKTISGVISNGMNCISVEQMTEFFKSHKDDTFTKSEPYIVFLGYPTVIYYTNSIEDFYRIFAKAYNESDYSKESGIVLNENI